MKLSQSLWFHTGLLTLGAAVAAWAYTRDKTVGVAQDAEATVLNTRPANIQRIVYESKDRKAVFEPQKDAKGEPWYLVTFERTPPTPLALGDAGAPPPAPKAPNVFPSGDAGKKVVEALAPLRALRSLGKVPDGKAHEYGLEKKDVSLTITLSGLERKFFVGDTAPGGTDMYVLDAANGQAYVIKGDPVRDLEGADSRLIERELHGWKEADVKSAKIVAGDKAREVVRGGADNRRFWADPASQDKADETVGNWMQKVDRVKPSEYTAKEPEGRSMVVRIEYTSVAGVSLGFFELVKTPDQAQAGKSQYYVMSERTHKYAKAVASVAEQLEQDLGALVK